MLNFYIFCYTYASLFHIFGTIIMNDGVFKFWCPSICCSLLEIWLIFCVYFVPLVVGVFVFVGTWNFLPRQTFGPWIETVLFITFHLQAFIHFSFLNALARTPSAEWTFLTCCWSFRENILISPSNRMLVVGFYRYPLSGWGSSFIFLFSWEFIS